MQQILLSSGSFLVSTQSIIRLSQTHSHCIYSLEGASAYISQSIGTALGKFLLSFSYPVVFPSKTRAISLSGPKQQGFLKALYGINHLHKNILNITTYHLSHPERSEIALRYAGTNASSAYNKIRALSIIETALAKDNLLVI